MGCYAFGAPRLVCATAKHQDQYIHGIYIRNITRQTRHRHIQHTHSAYIVCRRHTHFCCSRVAIQAKPKRRARHTRHTGSGAHHDMRESNVHHFRPGLVRGPKNDIKHICTKPPRASGDRAKAYRTQHHQILVI